MQQWSILLWDALTLLGKLWSGKIMKPEVNDVEIRALATHWLGEIKGTFRFSSMEGRSASARKRMRQ